MKMRMMAAVLALALLLTCAPGAVAAKKNVASIRFSVKVALAKVGQTATLKPRLHGVKMADLIWSSSDETVLSMSENVAGALQPGKAVITATDGSVRARMGVVVLPETVVVGVGQSAQLPRGGVEKYRVQDKSVASISRTGSVIGLSAGQTQALVICGRQKVLLGVTVTGGNSSGSTQIGSAAAQLDCADETDQIIWVEHTGGSRARLTVHEKQDGVWKQLYACDAYVGKNGMGKTREGDKKTPVGTYNLTTPFGLREDPGARIDYTQVTKYHYWCGTSDSDYYNQLVDERIVDRRHTSSDEYLIEYGGVYNYCMFIDYNAAGLPHKGSCIFLHCTGTRKYTAGCVAVSENVMKQIICWAKPGVKIVLQ